MNIIKYRFNYIQIIICFIRFCDYFCDKLNHLNVNHMKCISLTLALFLSLCSFLCQAQILPVEEQAVVLNTKEGDIKGKLLLPDEGKVWPVV